MCLNMISPLAGLPDGQGLSYLGGTIRSQCSATDILLPA